MKRERRGIVWIALMLAAFAARTDGADEPEHDRPAPPPLAVPPGLPRYEMQVRIEPESRRVTARERVTFTNRTSAPTGELVFHVYPRYKVPDSDRLILQKTLEFLRLSPEEAMDQQGRRLAVGGVRVEGKAVDFKFDP